MKTALLLSLLGAIIMTGCATFQPGSPQGGVDICAHRGASADAPENTMAAFALAHEMKADWFELDCTLTKDGEVIVIHDGSVDRTTNGKGAVADLTLAELQALDAGSWKEAKFAGERLPTLGESLDFAKGKIGVYIEIKNSDNDAELCEKVLKAAEDCTTLSGEAEEEVRALLKASDSRNVELTQKVVELVRERGMEKQILIQSFSPMCCATAKLEAPELRVEYLSGPKREDLASWEAALRWTYLLGLDGLNPSYGSLDPGRIAALQAAGRNISVWTIDDAVAMRNLAGWGVTGIITNRPGACLRTLEGLGKH
jgi:glycerophosphoryl diester phosphodiesterase